MKTRIWLALIIAFALVACGKDKFQTVPQLKLKSRNMDIVPVNGTLRLNVEYTDKEGDVSDSIFIVRQRLNIHRPVQLQASPYDIPNFPHTDKGEFEISLAYQFGLIFSLTPIGIPGSSPVRNEIDTLRLKIVAKDKAGNKSDTLVVDNVYVIR
ncbi:MAG TPA: hypothetical protein VKB95_05195 [Chitinophagaceae bacterium]|nr:hypothetical protein [Chitinophagaceae bacterium]